MRKLKDPCPVCGKPLDPNWRICPFCEAEVGTAPPTARRARRRRDGLIERPVAGGYPEAERSAGERPVSERPVAGATGLSEGGSTPPPRERSGPSTA
jgi:hypothetical protein